MALRPYHHGGGSKKGYPERAGRNRLARAQSPLQLIILWCRIQYSLLRTFPNIRKCWRTFDGNCVGFFSGYEDRASGALAVILSAEPPVSRFRTGWPFGE